MPDSQMFWSLLVVCHLRSGLTGRDYSCLQLAAGAGVLQGSAAQPVRVGEGGPKRVSGRHGMPRQK